MPPLTPGGSARVSLACADDDNQGQSLTVLWDYELDRQILFEKSRFDRISGWSNCEPCANGHTDPSLWTCRVFPRHLWRRSRIRSGQHVPH